MASSSVRETIKGPRSDPAILLRPTAAARSFDARPIASSQLATKPYGTEEIMRAGNALIEKGKWTCLEWMVRLNTIDLTAADQLGNGVANPDGVLKLWVDGVPRWEKADFRWRRHPEMGIDGPWIMGLHGGTTPPAPGEVLHWRLNHFAAARKYIGPKA